MASKYFFAVFTHCNKTNISNCDAYSSIICCQCVEDSVQVKKHKYVRMHFLSLIWDFLFLNLHYNLKFDSIIPQLAGELVI